MIDLKIADLLNGEGIVITARGVKRARLAQGLRRKNNYPAKQAQQREAMRLQCPRVQGATAATIQ